MSAITRFSLFSKCFVLLFSMSATYAPAQHLDEIEHFGSNPGSVDMHMYLPESLADAESYPLLVVVHGCSQTSKTLARQSGWNALAEQNGFAILYPQQRLTNNASRCWNWFNEEDVLQETGELESIRQMIDYCSTYYPIDKENIAIYGVSSGGAMTSALMANFPKLFRAGCVYAGGPFGVTAKTIKALKQMTSPDELSASHLANAVQKLHTDSLIDLPKVVVVHGLKDPLVSPKNGDMVALQWCELHGLGDSDIQKSQVNDRQDLNLSRWLDADGECRVVHLAIEGMVHCLAIDPGEGPQQGGRKSIFSFDFDFHSTYWIARELGLISD